MTELAEITLRTLQIGLVATAFLAPPGIFLGWWLARGKVPAKSVVQTIVALPMVVPPVAVGLVLLLVLSRRSPVGSFLLNTLGIEVVFTWKAAALAAAVMALPLLVRSCEQAFASVPSRFEQVAATLGASRTRVFFRVSLPLAKRGVIYGLVLAFSRSLGEFGATSLVAGLIPHETETLALGIYSNVINSHDSQAIALMMVSLFLAFGSIWASEHYLRRERSR